jgi:hypothetical protein
MPLSAPRLDPQPAQSPGSYPAIPPSTPGNRAKGLRQPAHFQPLATAPKVPNPKPRRCSHLPQSHTQGGTPLFCRCGFESAELPYCGWLVPGGEVAVPAGGVVVPVGGVLVPCGGVVVLAGGGVPAGGVAVPGGGCTPDPGGRTLIPGGPGRAAGGGGAGRVSLWLMNSRSKINSAFAGIGPLPASPYPSSYGMNKRRLPPICIPSNPVSQPGIT